MPMPTASRATGLMASAPTLRIFFGTSAERRSVAQVSK